MPHTFGKLELPVPVQAPPDSLGDPAIDVLADAIPAIMAHWASDAWQSAAPGEPFFRKVFRHDPERYDFFEGDVPALYIYREKDTPKDFLDDQMVVTSVICILWVEPPATQDKRSNREPFFNAFAKAFGELVNLECDPSWIQDGDLNESSLVYGTSITHACGFDFWFLQNVARTSIEIATPTGKPRKYPGVLSTLLVRESSQNDLIQMGFSGTGGLDVRITTGGQNPLTTQHFRLPTGLTDETSPSRTDSATGVLRIAGSASETSPVRVDASAG